MSDRELRPAKEKRSSLPALIKWVYGWWIRRHESLRETDVRELLTAFAVMDEEGRTFILKMAQGQAERWPQVPTRPALRLVHCQAESAPQHLQ
jgi:hypothetical protein